MSAINPYESPAISSDALEAPTLSVWQRIRLTLTTAIINALLFAAVAFVITVVVDMLWGIAVGYIRGMGQMRAPWRNGSLSAAMVGTGGFIFGLAAATRFLSSSRLFAIPANVVAYFALAVALGSWGFLLFSFNYIQQRAVRGGAIRDHGMMIGYYGLIVGVFVGSLAGMWRMSRVRRHLQRAMPPWEGNKPADSETGTDAQIESLVRKPRIGRFTRSVVICVLLSWLVTFLSVAFSSFVVLEIVAKSDPKRMEAWIEALFIGFILGALIGAIGLLLGAFSAWGRAAKSRIAKLIMTLIAYIAGMAMLTLLCLAAVLPIYMNREMASRLVPPDETMVNVAFAIIFVLSALPTWLALRLLGRLR